MIRNAFGNVLGALGSVLVVVSRVSGCGSARYLSDHGVDLNCKILPAIHRFSIGLRHRDLQNTTPSSVATMYVLDDRLKPRKTPSSQRVPMLPSGLLCGPFVGSLYRTHSAKPSTS